MDHKTFLSTLPPEMRADLAERSTRAGLVHLAGHLGLIGLCSAAILLLPFGWLLMPVQGVLLVFLFTLEHECTHRTPFASDWLFQSFPSGHSAAVGSFFGAFSMLVPRLRLLFFLGALAIGITRVVVGAHYPSDVAAGLLIGLWTATMVAFLFARQGWLFRLDENGWPRPKREMRGVP